jgi:hypothetical protein
VLYRESIGGRDQNRQGHKGDNYNRLTGEPSHGDALLLKNSKFQFRNKIIDRIARIIWI